MKGNNLIVARVIIVVFIIPIMAWAAVSRLFGELVRVPIYIWSDWCEDAADAAHIWRTGTMPDKGAWALNPWVAAYTFAVQHGNIDQLEEISR